MVLFHVAGCFVDPVALRDEVLSERGFTLLAVLACLIYMATDALNLQRPLVPSGAEGNGNGARFVGAFLAGLASGTAPAVQNDGFRGRHLPSSYGRDAGEAYARVSFKPERAFNVIAHVRDWEHAETVHRRCLRTV